MERQFCATAYIIENNKTLLIFHKKLRKWLPPGGHIDSNETPPEAAKREAKEETGLEIEFIKQENLWINDWNASSFERPFMCLLEEIPQYKDQPSHQHMDFIYVAYPVSKNLKQNELETEGLRWFSLDEIENLNSDDIFSETTETIRVIFKTFDREFAVS